MIDLRVGHYKDALGDVECDAVICDPPYSERTHGGQRHGRKDARYCDPSEHPILSSRGLPYESWGEADVIDFVRFWDPRCRGWIAVMTSHDLVPMYSDLLTTAGRYVFAPVPCIQTHMNVRLAGDGPANWTVYLVVARPRGMKGGALPGAYVGKPHDAGENALDRSKRIVPGGKPLWLMQAIVRDYSSVDDLVCDPCAGGATTLLAAASQGRDAIGAEIDPDTHEKALARLGAGYTADMFSGAVA